MSLHLAWHRVQFFNREEGNPIWTVTIEMKKDEPFDPAAFAKTYTFPDFISDAKTKDIRKLMNVMEYDRKIYPTK